LERVGRWGLGRAKRPRVRVDAAGAAVPMIVQCAGGMSGDSEPYPGGVRVAIAFVSYATYLWKSLWPRELIVLYPFHGPPPWGTLVVSVLVLTILTAIAWRERVR